MRIGGTATLLVPVLVGAGAVIAACGETPPPQDSGLTDADLRAEVGEASVFQQSLLSDGLLTYPEYESAVLATVQCLRDRGISIITEPHTAPGGVLVFEFGGSTQFAGEAADRENEAARLAYEACYHEHQNVVDLAWARQTQVDERTLAEARSALRECLEEAGVEGIPPNAKGRDFQAYQHLEVFPKCQEKVGREFDIAGFGG
jgi:hypothetical protein